MVSALKFLPLLPMILFAALALTAEEVGAATAIYVSPDGDDTWSGALPAPLGNDGPFASISRARDEVRNIKAAGGLPAGGVVVQLAGGAYEMDDPVELTDQDSGSTASPIVYRAAPGAEVRLVGGRVLGGFAPVTDPAALEVMDEAARAKVMACDLKALGITDYGSPTAGGMELFYRDQPMTLSRWPNEGFVKIRDLLWIQPKNIRSARGDAVGKFIYEGDRPERWLKEKDLWLHGYWFWDWSDQRQPVKAIDTGARTIELKPPYHGYGYRKDQWYYAFNALSEIDTPGEWYVDREDGVLYFWPPGDLEDGDAVVSIARGLVSMEDTSHVTFMGLTMESCRGTAVQMRGGTGNRISSCVIRNLGGWAASIAGGSDNGVIGCDIYGTGEGGISLSGGDRKTLAPGGHFASNNHIHHYSRVNRISRPGVRLDGVGNRASHNLIHNAPHQAMSFGGNEHVIEFNEIHSVCYESNDAGAIYAGRDWTMRGNVIRHNYFHHISGLGGRGCVGVYLDDSFSSANIYGNLFWKVTRAAMIGGGRDNTIANNIFVDCNPSIHIDDRGVGWANQYIVRDGSWQMYPKLANVSYDRPPYSERYPALARILDEDPNEPFGNVVERNIIVGGVAWSVRCKREYNTIDNNMVDEDPLFVDAQNGDFRLREGSPALKMGFEPLLLDSIGLQDAGPRASWPVEHQVRTELITVREDKPVRPKGPGPTVAIPRINRAPQINGEATRVEWRGAAELPIAKDIQGQEEALPSVAWVAHDGENLLVAVTNEVATAQPMATGDVWGTNEAVELALRARADNKGPIIVLRGFASGHFESSDESGAAPDLVKRAGQGVVYAAKVHSTSRWDCEWEIPLASIGVNLAENRKLPFNLSVRKTATGLWLMWQGSFGYTWQVENTGFVELAP